MSIQSLLLTLYTLSMRMRRSVTNDHTHEKT